MSSDPCLNDVPTGQRVRIESLPSHPDLRDRLWALGLRPGSQLEVLRRGWPGGILHLADGLMEFMLRREHAAEIRVSAPDGTASAEPPPETKD